MKWLVAGCAGLALFVCVVLAGAGVVTQATDSRPRLSLAEEDDSRLGSENEGPVFVIPTRKPGPDGSLPPPHSEPPFPGGLPTPERITSEPTPGFPTLPVAPPPVVPLQPQPLVAMPELPGPRAWGTDCRFEGCRTRVTPVVVSPPVADRTRLWVDTEYLLWWTREAGLPPLVTTGTPASLGILGRAGTSVLYGNETTDVGPRSGVRVTAGVWLDECGKTGVEVSGFWSCQGSEDFQAASSGEPLLARPFFDPVTGQQNVQQVANLARAALPNLLPVRGGVATSFANGLWGADANLLCKLCEGPTDACDYRVSLLTGFRFLQFDEELMVVESLAVPAGAVDLAGTRFVVGDQFQTRNDFYGGQVGGKVELVADKVSLQLGGKVALGAVVQAADVQGDTLILEPGVPRVAGRGGLLALPTNMGHHSRHRFAVLPEGNVKLGCNLTSQLRCTIGYSILYLSSVARPGNQVDLVVNPSQLPPGRLSGPARPTFQFQGTDFWAQGITFGLEYAY